MALPQFSHGQSMHRYRTMWGHLTSTMDQYVTVQGNMEGPQGATLYTDANGHVWTATANAIIDTNNKKFGNSSMKFDGNGDLFSTTYSVDFVMGTEDFTVDFWFCMNSTTQTRHTVFELWQDTQNFVYIYFTSGGSNTYSFNGASKESNVALWAIVGNYKSYTAGVWNHFAIVKQGSTTKNYINGVNDTQYVSANRWPAIAGGVPRLGGNGQAGTWFANGWLDELRISKGIARWTANFTPPSAPY